MTRTQLSPFGGRAIGFDQISDLLDRVTRENPVAYPPYDIEKLSDDNYKLTMALAGFKSDNISVEIEGETLTIAATIPQEEEETPKTYLHKGIAQRSFERKFHLAPHIIVQNAEFTDGLLEITIVREIPETLKPRKIEITKQ